MQAITFFISFGAYVVSSVFISTNFEWVGVLSYLFKASKQYRVHIDKQAYVFFNIKVIEIQFTYISSTESVQFYDFKYIHRAGVTITTISFRTFLITSKRNPTPISSDSAFSSNIHSPRKPVIHFMSLQVYLFWTFHIQLAFHTYEYGTRRLRGLHHCA